MPINNPYHVCEEDFLGLLSERRPLPESAYSVCGRDGPGLVEAGDCGQPAENLR